MVDLYQLLPQYIRSVDEQCGYVFRDIIYALEQDFNTAVSDIQGLKDLVDIDIVSSILLPKISAFLGENPLSSWSQEKKRIFIKSLIFLYHDYGRHRGLRAMLNLLNRSDIRIRELFKSEPYERFDYSVQSEYYGIRAARIRAEDSSGNPVRLSDEFSEDELNLIFATFPAHVLEVPDGRTYEFEEELDPITSPFSSLSLCAEWEESLEVIDTGLDYSVSAPTSCNVMGLQINIKLYCEDSCQVMCEASPSCEVSGCQTFCQDTCQTVCMLICQEACQGTCESECMVTEQ